MRDKKILFVDDEEKILSMLEKVFVNTDVEVRTAQSGEAALELLRKENIHVMFFDLNMPAMNGIELCRRVRKERPMDMIFALTGYAGLFELAECRAAGFDDYFIKPMDLKLLRETARTAFEKLLRWKKDKSR